MTATAPRPGPTLEVIEARDLVVLYAERIAIAASMALANRPTGAMAQAVMDKGAELDAACEAFRRKHYPRKHRCCVGLYTVFVTSPTGRSTTTVLDLFEEYRDQDPTPRR